MVKVIAVLQARMSSTRLPGKVLKPILGRPMIGRHIDRLKRCTRIDRLVVATSAESSDDAIESFCAANDISCFRGALHDVLARFDGAVKANMPCDHIVRLTADCPLADPAIIDAIVDMHLAEGSDYTSNTVDRTFPDGLDAEVATRPALERAVAEATEAYDREHVTPYLYRVPGRFRMAQYKASYDASHLRWTVDTPTDFLMVEEVYRRLLPVNEAFDYYDMLRLVTQVPAVAAINTPVSPAA